MPPFVYSTHFINPSQTEEFQVPQTEKYYTHYRPFGYLLCKVLHLSELLNNWMATDQKSNILHTLNDDFSVVEKSLWAYIDREKSERQQKLDPLLLENADDWEGKHNNNRRLFNEYFHEAFGLVIESSEHYTKFNNFVEFANHCCDDVSLCQKDILMMICTISHTVVMPKEDHWTKDLGRITDYMDEGNSRKVRFDYLIEDYKGFDKKDFFKIVRRFSITTLETLIAALLYELFSQGKVIKRCKNCGQYFIPQNRTDEIYCDNISPQDESRTCKEYGSQRLWYDRIKADEVKKLARNTYMAKQMLAKRNPDIPEYQKSFELYKHQNKEWKVSIKAGTKSEADYIEWLKAVKEKKVL